MENVFLCMLRGRFSNSPQIINGLTYFLLESPTTLQEDPYLCETLSQYFVLSRENYADFWNPEISDYIDFRKITPIRESERWFFRALMYFRRDNYPPSSVRRHSPSTNVHVTVVALDGGAPLKLRGDREGLWSLSI